MGKYIEFRKYNKNIFKDKITPKINIQDFLY